MCPISNAQQCPFPSRQTLEMIKLFHFHQCDRKKKSWCFLVVLICACLIIYEAKHLFMCLLAACVCSSLNRVFLSLVWFFFPPYWIGNWFWNVFINPKSQGFKFCDGFDFGCFLSCQVGGWQWEREGPRCLHSRLCEQGASVASQNSLSFPPQVEQGNQFFRLPLVQRGSRANPSLCSSSC